MYIYGLHECFMPMNVRRGRQFPWTRVTDRCELPCGCWERDPGPPEEQPVLLTTKTYYNQP